MTRLADFAPIEPGRKGPDGLPGHSGTDGAPDLRYRMALRILAPVEQFYWIARSETGEHRPRRDSGPARGRAGCGATEEMEAGRALGALR